MPDETVLEWTHPDQSRRVVLTRRPNGLYSYEELVFTIEEDQAFGTYEYWHVSHRSGGLYASIIDAQNDARLEIPWLEALLTSPG